MALNLPAWCAPYIGWPYLKGGKTRTGADCIGYFIAIRRERFGDTDMPDYHGPLWEKGADVDAIAHVAEAFANLFEEIGAEDVQEGDAILLRMRGVAMHIGLIVRPGVMLHLAEGADSCAEDYTQRIWRRRVAGFYRAKLKPIEQPHAA